MRVQAVEICMANVL